MKLGIIQGRLSHPREGHQTTSIKWKTEIEEAISLGLNHVEWIIDTDTLLSNPLLLGEVPDILFNNISSVCLDNIVDKRIFEYEFFDENIIDVCKKLDNVGFRKVTLPILEESRVEKDGDLGYLCRNLTRVCELFPNFRFFIECDNNSKTVNTILDSHNNLNATYDTGNITAMNFDHDMYISEIGDKIKNVHLKDRQKNSGKSLGMFKGDTHFDSIFQKLSEVGYDGIFTLQMARGIPGSEKETIMNYTETFRRLYERYF